MFKIFHQLNGAVTYISASESPQLLYNFLQPTSVKIVYLPLWDCLLIHSAFRVPPTREIKLRAILQFFDAKAFGGDFY